MADRSSFNQRVTPHTESPYRSVFPLTHALVSSSLEALTSNVADSESQTPRRSESGRGDPWDLEADHLRAEVAKLREEVERLIEAEELLIFIYQLRQNRASRHHRPHKPPSGPRGEVPGAPAADLLAPQPVRSGSVPIDSSEFDL